jgi:hypothetical protein
MRFGNGIPLDLSELDDSTQREFLECRHNREVLALMGAAGEQEAIAEQGGLGRETRRSVDGLGAPVLEVNAASFHQWGLRLGYECWNDRGFVREFWRDNPAARVKAGGTRVQVGYRQVQSSELKVESGGGVRTRKSYGVI